MPVARLDRLAVNRVVDDAPAASDAGGRRPVALLGHLVTDPLQRGHEILQARPVRRSSSLAEPVRNTEPMWEGAHAVDPAAGASGAASACSVPACSPPLWLSWPAGLVCSPVERAWPVRSSNVPSRATASPGTVIR